MPGAGMAIAAGGCGVALGATTANNPAPKAAIRQSRFPITVTRPKAGKRSLFRPIFNTRCAACHGGTAGLFLDSYENVMRGGLNGLAVVPRDPSSSRVGSGYMPYGGPPLTQAQAATLSNWVAAGARDN